MTSKVEKMRETTFRRIQTNVPGKIRFGIRFEFPPGRLSRFFETWLFTFCSTFNDGDDAEQSPNKTPEQNTSRWRPNKTQRRTKQKSRRTQQKNLNAGPNVRKPERRTFRTPNSRSRTPEQCLAQPRPCPPWTQPLPGRVTDRSADA